MRGRTAKRPPEIVLAKKRKQVTKISPKRNSKFKNNYAKTLKKIRLENILNKAKLNCMFKKLNKISAENIYIENFLQKTVNWHHLESVYWP